MSNHSISKINMTALKKKYRRMCNEININVYSLMNNLYERTILLFCLEVAFNTYFKSRKQGILH